MRADLPLGVMAAQLVHAAGESYGALNRCGCDPECFGTELWNGQFPCQHGVARGYGCGACCDRFVPIVVHVVVLQVDDEQGLYAAAAALATTALKHVVFREPDLSDQITAIGIAPMPDKRVLPSFVRRLPLLGARR